MYCVHTNLVGGKINTTNSKYSLRPIVRIYVSLVRRKANVFIMKFSLPNGHVVFIYQLACITKQWVGKQFVVV